MSRFWTIKEIKAMDSVTMWTTVLCIIFVIGIGAAFSVAFFIEGVHPLLCLFPLVGFSVLAWERQDGQ